MILSKKLGNFCHFEKGVMTQQSFFTYLIENAYFPVDLASDAMYKQHENNCSLLQRNTNRNIQCFFFSI